MSPCTQAVARCRNSQWHIASGTQSALPWEDTDESIHIGCGDHAGVSATAFAQAPTWTVPEESQRCPSKWGAADERGSGNHQKPAAVMNAAKLIKTGEVFELAHVLGPSMAFFGTRRFDVHTKRTFMNQFSNMRGSNEEVVITELGQVGTQFDGFAHQTHLNSWYNCQKVDENTERNGFKKFGIHNVGALFTRGVLIELPPSRASRCWATITKSRWRIWRAP
jgi:hypothetical protein